MDSEWDWDYFKAAMDEHSSSHENETKDLLQLVKEYDKIVSEIVGRSTSIVGRRPQDFVVAKLATRAFRLTVSAIRISVSGYSETVPHLNRTIFEIGLWLLLIKKDPIGASLGYLLLGVDEEIKILEYDLQVRSNGGELQGVLPNNLENLKDYQKKLEDIINSNELSLEEIRSRYGKLKVWEVCEAFGLEDVYKVGYAYMCGHVHEKGLADHAFIDESQEGVRNFIMSPECSGCVEGAIDALHNLHVSLFTATEIIGDSELLDKCKDIGEKLSKYY